MNGDLERKIHEIHSTCTELRTEQVEQGKGIATLVERTEQQEKRLDKVEEDCRSTSKRAGAGTGGAAGVVGGVLAGFFANLLGFGNGS